MIRVRLSKIVGVIFLFVFLFCIGTTSVFAKNKVTQTLDLTSHPSEDRLSDEGWSWDDTTKTLILEDATFEMTGVDPCIKFLNSEDITVIFEGVNNLTSDKQSVFLGEKEGTDGTLTFKSTNNGILNLNVQTYYTTDGGNLGDTIHYPYNLNIESGTINSNGGFLVDGVVTISGGNINIDACGFPDSTGLYVVKQVKITGGNVDIKSNSAAIMVTGTGSSVIDEYQDGVIISGGNINLTAIDESIPSIHAGFYRRKNIIIDGGNITLNSYFGIYTAEGIISVNNVDGFDARNVRKDVFKVGNKAGNEVKIKGADYSKVDEAIARAKSLNKEDYEDFSAVTDAINAVVRDKSVLDQSEVDAMAYNINNAIESLKLKNVQIPQEADKSDTNKDMNNVEPTNIDNPTTYDDILKYIIYFVLSIVGLGSSTFLYKKQV